MYVCNNVSYQINNVHSPSIRALTIRDSVSQLLKLLSQPTS